jgi:hypothetical protein
VRFHRTLLAVLACASALAPGAAQSQAHDEFAYERALRPAGDSGVYETPIPEDVYLVVRRADFGDLRVMNGRGDAVPHAIAEVEDTREREERELSLPFFPLYGMASKSRASIADGVVILAPRTGAVIEVGRAAGPDEGPSLEAYLVDGSGASAPPSRLELEWEPGAGPVYARVSIEASADLEHWVWAGEGTVASLEYQGQALERGGVAISAPPHAKYFRLRSEPELPPLTAVRARSETVTRRDARGTRRVAAQALEGGRLRYDLGGAFVVEWVDLVLAERNVLLKARIASSLAEAGPFAARGEHLFFKLEGSTPLKSDPLTLAPAVRARFWEVVVDPRGGGVGEPLPELEIEYRPRSLLWVARGEPPFSLVYGSASAEDAALAPAEILGLVPGGKPARAPALERAERAGRAALVEPAHDEPPDLRTWALWAALVAAAALLAALSLRVARRA